MKRKRFSLGSLLWSAIQVGIGAVLLVQVAQWRIATTSGDNGGGPDESLLLAASDRTIPPTYTPRIRTTVIPGESTYFATPVSTVTLVPSDEIPRSSAPPTVTPTPFVAPDYLKEPVAVHNVSEPPRSAECGEHGFVFASQFPSTIWGSSRDYYAYLPPCYGHDGRVYPVLYLFHGSGHNDDQWVHLGLAQHLDQGIKEGRYPPFIAIMPDAGAWNDTSSGGERSIEGVTLTDLIPFVDANFCTWQAQSGRALAGISRGGYWALMIAFRHPELFTAVSGHSSQLRLETDPGPYNPLVTYATADLSSLRIWLDWGEFDFLRAGQQELHELLMNAGVAHSVSLNGGGHANYYWFEHVREYMDWHAQSWSLARETYPVCEQ